ncbi:anti-sigma factor [Flavobacterium terrae]|uniref:Anti-sigma-K factor rskA n=1 Tax=Flavobacterium terrae TaxID=415425 RepID=A0A1M6CX44_9FLAO|nr:anti-sigma factor [Flavobacterium terrae]SHI65556.1 Anti-sigma-K factor rskA [Flavobacterium terrae]
MDIKDYIESGILELYVYGLLDEAQNKEVLEMSKKHKEIENEIIAIEKSILSLSTSFSPFLSVQNFEKIKAELEIKHNKIIELKSKSSRYNYVGWAAAALFLLFIGYQYQQQSILKDANNELNQTIVSSENENRRANELLNIIRDNNNTVVTLAGQTVAPKAVAKVYWNKETQKVYIDASGLPTPPEGKEYQVWSLKLKPALTPTSIGLLSEFNQNGSKIFEVSKTQDAEAFGITLEPKGGSKTPTMEQLYTLGSV